MKNDCLQTKMTIITASALHTIVVHICTCYAASGWAQFNAASSPNRIRDGITSLLISSVYMHIGTVTKAMRLQIKDVIPDLCFVETQSNMTSSYFKWRNMITGRSSILWSDWLIIFRSPETAFFIYWKFLRCFALSYCPT